MKSRILEGLGINLLLLGIVSFINDASSHMIGPILPMFIVSVGGGGFSVGLIGGLGESVSSLLKVFSGYLSDRIGKRKILITFGYMISSVSKIFFPFVTRWSHLLILKPLERIGKGIRTAPRDALIADSSLKNQRGKGFGLHKALDTSGALFGSFLAFIFIWFFQLQFRSILLIAALLGFISLIPLTFVKEPKFKIRNKFSLQFQLDKLGMKFNLFLIIVTLFALGNFSYMFLILKARGAFQLFLEERLSNAIPILLYILFNMPYAAFSMPIGSFSDKVGKGRILLCGYALFTFTCIGFIFSVTIYHFVLLFFLYGLFRASVDAVQRAYASDLAGDKLRGTALGVFHASIGLAAFPASIIAGILWDLNPALTFIYGATFSIVSMVLLTILLFKI